MRLHDLDHRRICILGFGREGQATLRALTKHAPNADITIADANSELQVPGFTLQVGPEYLQNLDRFDVIIKSPGIPPSSQLTAHSSKLTSATQIFLDTIAGTGATVIGITGSKGKSTTATLIYEMLKASGKDTILVGNIGRPALDELDAVREGTLVVEELSSYQLMDLTRSPSIAVVTAFFPEHLDYHGSLAAYLEAKKHITRFQRPEDWVFYNAQFPEAKEIAQLCPGTKVPFTPMDAPLPLSQTKLLGEHNLGNMAAAFLVAKHLGVPAETCLKVLRSFPGLPHRLEHLGVHHGIAWVDDAISTTPESTIAALQALGDRVRTIILGGQDRGNDFTELGRVIAASRIEHVILFPGSGPRIRAAIEAAGAHVTLHDAPTMEEAVKIAREKTLRNTKNRPKARVLRVPRLQDSTQGKDGNVEGKPLGLPSTPVVLLSTASPSYNMFKDFEQKGTLFQQCVRSPGIAK